MFCQFSPYWSTPPAARGSRSPTLQIAFCHRLSSQECSDGFWPHLTPPSHHPSPCPLPLIASQASPSQPFGNLLSAKNCPSLLQFREPAVIPREPASIPRSLQGTSGAQPGDWKEGDSIEFSVWESAVGLVFSYLGSFQIAIMPPHVSRAITLRIS